MKTPEQMAEEYASSIYRLKYYVDGRRKHKQGQEGLRWLAGKNAFLAGYKAAKPQWISVKERLPEVFKVSDFYRDSNCVLITVAKESDQQTYVTVAHLAQFKSEEPMWTACRCSVSGNEVEPNEWKFDQISHWMPLSAAPNEDKALSSSEKKDEPLVSTEFIYGKHW